MKSLLCFILAGMFTAYGVRIEDVPGSNQVADEMAHSIYVEEFISGFKYVMDNLELFKNMSQTEFLAHIRSQYYVPQSYEVYSLQELLSKPEHSFSNEFHQFLMELSAGINASRDWEEFIRSLTIFERQIQQLGASEKEAVTKFTVVFKNIMKVLYADLQYYNSCCDFGEDVLKGWWEKWGRCAAGIVGGAGLGAFAGAAGGAVLAGVGAVPGAIIGSIAGGLAGASEGC